VITQPDLTLIPVTGNPGVPGSGRFVLTGALPASALGKGGPAAVSLVVARGDRALLVDSAAGSKAEPFHAVAGGWQWKAIDKKERIDSVVVHSGAKGDLRFEIRGRTFAVPGGDKLDATAAGYAVSLGFLPAGGDGKAIESALTFAECREDQQAGGAAIVCTGAVGR